MIYEEYERELRVAEEAYALGVRNAGTAYEPYPNLAGILTKVARLLERDKVNPITTTEIEALREIEKAAKLIALMPEAERPRPPYWSERVALKKALFEYSVSVNSSNVK